MLLAGLNGGEELFAHPTGVQLEAETLFSRRVHVRTEYVPRPLRLVTGGIGDGERRGSVRGLVRVPNLHPGLLLRAGDRSSEVDQIETAIDSHDLSRPGHPIRHSWK